MALMRLIFCVVLIVVANQKSFCQEEWMRNALGLEIGVPGASMKYPLITLGMWYRHSKKSWIALEGGYGGRGLPLAANRLDRTYRESHRRYMVSAQYAWFVSEDNIHWSYLCIGPYYMSMQAEIGKSFIDDFPGENVTAHYGADYTLNRYGLIPGVGVRLFLNWVVLDARLQVPVYYEDSAFADLKDPLLVLDFVPAEIEDYQHSVSRVVAGVAFSIRLGIVLSSDASDPADQ